MSQQETHVGKAKKVFAGNPIKFVKNYINLFNLAIPDYYDRNNDGDLMDFFQDETYGEYAIIGNAVYEIIENEQFDDDVFKAVETNDEIDYVLSFYNGGCGFEEALEKAINSIENN